MNVWLSSVFGEFSSVFGVPVNVRISSVLTLIVWISASFGVPLNVWISSVFSVTVNV